MGTSISQSGRFEVWEKEKIPPGNQTRPARTGPIGIFPRQRHRRDKLPQVSSEKNSQVWRSGLEGNKSHSSWKYGNKYSLKILLHFSLCLTVKLMNMSGKSKYSSILVPRLHPVRIRLRACLKIFQTEDQKIMVLTKNRRRSLSRWMNDPAGWMSSGHSSEWTALRMGCPWVDLKSGS